MRCGIHNSYLTQQVYLLAHAPAVNPTCGVEDHKPRYVSANSYHPISKGHTNGYQNVVYNTSLSK